MDGTTGYKKQLMENTGYSYILQLENRAISPAVHTPWLMDKFKVSRFLHPDRVLQTHTQRR